jgi:rhamnose utilization protein RhaD (predicted bifunctional aldolase and dehydrogenase)
MRELEEKREELIALSHELGAGHRDLAILGEGNTSAKIDEETFIVKVSGSSLGTLGASDIVECRSTPLIAMLDRNDLIDQQIEDQLHGSRVDPSGGKPSVEALFHAWLLSLPGVEYVGHTHPGSVNRILCSARAIEFATRRMFPDEVVFCGVESVFVPYSDPGLKLAQYIRSETRAFMRKHGVLPRVILLENHGIITIGPTPQAVKASTFMTAKAAGIFTDAALLGGPQFLSDSDVDLIAHRLDENYRPRALK